MRLEPQSTPSATFGTLQLIEKIGQGGMASVHRGYLTGMGGFRREVVLKRILSELASDEHFVMMFDEEARRAGRAPCRGGR